MSDIFKKSDMLLSESDVYEEFKIHKLVEKSAKENNIDPATAHLVWKHYFRLKAGVFKGFADGMRNIFKEMDKILQAYCKDNQARYSIVKLENLYAVFREVDEKLFKEAEHDRKLFWEIKTELGDFKDIDKDKVILRNYEQQLSLARKEYFEQVKEVDQKKEKYHKKAFELEKAEIKKAIAEKEEEINRHTERFEALQKEVKKTIDKYRRGFEKLNDSGNNLKQKSYEYTQAKERVDTKRADFILEKLEKYGQQAKIQSEDLEAADFTYINTSEVIKYRQPNEKIVIKKMERYKGTKNKQELIAQVKREMAEEKERRERGERVGAVDSDDDVEDNDGSIPRPNTKRRGTPVETLVVPFNNEDNDDDTAPDAIPALGRSNGGGAAAESDNGEIPGPSHARGIGSKYLVTTSFKKEQANQMNLTQGKFVKLIMPANDKGFAFGEKKGRFGRKIKGYFPMDCVVPAD